MIEAAQRDDQAAEAAIAGKIAERQAQISAEAAAELARRRTAIAEAARAEIARYEAVRGEAATEIARALATKLAAIARAEASPS